MSGRRNSVRGFLRLELILVVAIVALSATVARYGALKFHYGALGFAGLLVASVAAFVLLILALCILMGILDVYVHKNRMRAKARKGAQQD